ncbi:MAG: hypothetical protein MRY63_09675 [Neomegalonema sp.]|nr:hypothetical protein [Neomegalonema sp.]
MSEETDQPLFIEEALSEANVPPAQCCLACGYRQFSVANGMEDLADEHFSVEYKIFEEIEGQAVAYLEGVSFDEYVHVFTCLRCGHQETHFLPPISPPLRTH